MKEFKLKIKILTDILEKKVQLLNSILNITINQQSVLSSQKNEDEAISFFKEMNKEKQKCIDEVIRIDEIFNSTFISMKTDFETKAPIFKDEVKNMQDMIKEIETFDTKIRLAEERNKILTQKKLNIEKEIFSSSKQVVANKYKDNYLKKELNF